MRNNAQSVTFLKQGPLLPLPPRPLPPPPPPPPPPPEVVLERRLEVLEEQLHYLRHELDERVPVTEGDNEIEWLTAFQSCQTIRNRTVMRDIHKSGETAKLNRIKKKSIIFVRQKMSRPYHHLAALPTFPNVHPCTVHTPTSKFQCSADPERNVITMLVATGWRWSDYPEPVATEVIQIDLDTDQESQEKKTTTASKMAYD